MLLYRTEKRYKTILNLFDLRIDCDYARDIWKCFLCFWFLFYWFFNFSSNLTPVLFRPLLSLFDLCSAIFKRCRPCLDCSHVVRASNTSFNHSIIGHLFFLPPTLYTANFSITLESFLLHFYVFSFWNLSIFWPLDYYVSLFSLLSISGCNQFWSFQCFDLYLFSFWIA